jgi:flagellar motor protein MotB
MFKIFLTCITALSLFAQTPQPSVIKKPFDSILFDVTQNYDDTISAVGFSNVYKQTHVKRTYHNPFEYLRDASENKYGKKAYLITINKNLQVVLERFAKIPEFSEAKSVVKTPQNGFFVGGYTLDGTLFLAKLDAMGNTLFVRKFGTKNYDRLNNIIHLSDGGVLIVGSSTTSRDTHDPMFRTGLGLNDIFLTRFDMNGRMLWSKKYGTSYDDRGIDAAEAYDGSIVVVAATTYHKHHDVTLMRIGENGNKIWLRHFKLQKLITPKKLIRLHDDNFLVALTQQNDVGKKSIRLIKFDLQNNLLIDQTLQTYYPSELNDIKEYANSTIIGVGATRDRYNTDALMVVLDENLELTCQEHFGGENVDTFNAVAILRDSTALAVGMSIPQHSQVQNMYIAHLSTNCSVIPAQPQPIQKEKKVFQDFSPFETTHKSSLYKELHKLLAPEIASGKVTLQSDLSITLTAPKLLFKNGQYKLSRQQQNFLAKLWQKLIPFIKKHKKQIQHLEIIGHTSSQWENVNFTKRYNNNMDLSLKRAYSVSQHLFKHQDRKTQQLLVHLLKDSGLSYSKNIKQGNKEDQKKSRRIVIKIVQKH